MEIMPLGDSALIIRVVDDFANNPEAALHAVLGALHSLETARLPGVIELAPAYSTVGLFFDAAEVARAASGQKPDKWLRTRIEEVIKTNSVGKKKGTKSRLIEIPVCYDREFAWDMDDVARASGLTMDEVIRRHSTPVYRVCCVGFIAGFPFLSGLPSKLTTPRRASPRREIPAGSVGVGGAQTGVYPGKSPGGWNLIGRTPLRLFDKQHQPPALLGVGDRVRFRRISREEFEAFAQ